MKVNTKARIVDVIRNIKKAMGYPSRLNPDFLNSEIARMLNHPGYEDEINEILENKRLASSKEIIHYFYPAVIKTKSMNNVVLANCISDMMKEKHQESKSFSDDDYQKEVYSKVMQAFTNYRKKHQNISEYSIKFWINIDVYAPTLWNLRNEIKEQNDSFINLFIDSIWFTDESQVSDMFANLIFDGKINGVFTKVNNAFLKDTKNIRTSKDPDLAMLVVSASELSIICQRNYRS